MANYQEELRNFQQQWNLPTYNLDRLADNVQALRFADSFLTGASPDRTPADQYVKWLARTLSLYLETHTIPNEEGKYISSFDTQAFYDSFKRLVQAKYEADAEKNGETPLQVQDLAKQKDKEIRFALSASKSKYKKTLPTIWQERLKKGDIKLETLKTITDNSHAAFGDNNPHSKEELDAKLTNLVAAREAMKQLRASRSGVWGWLWKKIFNRGQNQQEKEYLQDLNNKINELSNDYNVQEKVAQLTGKTVLGKAVAVEKEARETQIKEVKKQARPAKGKGLNIQPVASGLAYKMDQNFMSDLKSEWKDKLPKDVQIADITLRYGIMPRLLQGVKQLNETFDKRVAENGDPKKEMERVVKGVFKLTVTLSQEHLVNKTELQKAEAIKVIAQETVKMATAAAIYPELGALVESSINHNVYQYKTITREGKDYLKEVDKYDEIDNNREQLFKGDSTFAENNVSKSPKIAQEPKHNVPTINQGKK